MNPSPNRYATLISVADLKTQRAHRDWLVVDCRFDLADPAAGERDFVAGHIPGAVYAHLDRDLSDHGRKGMGRHPFPSDTAFSRLLSRWGFATNVQVVCYDAANGTHAARLWWMLQAVGHTAAAVLDGGFAAWERSGAAVESELSPRNASDVQVQFNPGFFAGFEDVGRLLATNALALVDARAEPRYRGEVEPIDPVAGHVPGALNRPFSENIHPDGRFKPAEQLRQEFEALLPSRAPAAVAHMCGSGVTACHNLLAMHYAGLPGARLFAPSWSGWISDSRRPVAIGS